MHCLPASKRPCTCDGTIVAPCLGVVSVRFPSAYALTLEKGWTCAGMQVPMNGPTIIRLILGAWLLMAAAWVAHAQAQPEEQPKSEKSRDEKTDEKPVDQPDSRDGYDRPTAYPRITFGKKKTDKPDESQDESKQGEVKEAGNEDGASRISKARVYLLDVSDAMIASISIDGSRETTRIEHMRSLATAALDDLAKLPESRRRELGFNLITFGKVQDFAAGGSLARVDATTIGKAKEWLKELEAGGNSDLYSLLMECFKQGPESAALLVGGVPAAPAGISAEELKEYEFARDYIVDAVKRLRAKGSKTTLDIIGVGLTREAREYYERLAAAGGGKFLEG